MAASGKVKVQFNDDGTVTVVAKDMQGTEKELLEALNAMAKEVGGELVVEKHVPGAHTHSHGDVGEHTHGKGK